MGINIRFELVTYEYNRSTALETPDILERYSQACLCDCV